MASARGILNIQSLNELTSRIMNTDYCTVPVSDSIGYLTIRDIRRFPLGSHTERTPTHTPVPPNPAVEPPPASLDASQFFLLVTS